MKKKTICLLLAAVIVLSGCGSGSYAEDIKDAAKVAEKVADASKELAGEVADAAGIDKEEVSQTMKEALSDVKEEAKEAASEIADEAADASKEFLKEYAKQKIQEMEDEALGSDDVESESAILKNPGDIALTDTDGSGKNYTFTYDGKTFDAIYTPDNWKIKDSYRIQNGADMLVICQALIDVHPVHGKDMESYRTAEDMVYEWKIHNIACEYLDDDDPLKSHAHDVDFDPNDQGMTLEEFYKSRTGKDLDLTEFLGG
jgi:hypothetical protein